MNWDGLERLLGSCVGNESVNRKGLIRVLIVGRRGKGRFGSFWDLEKVFGGKILVLFG